MDEIPIFCLTLKISSLEETVFDTLSQDKNLAGAIRGFKRRLTATDVMCLSNYLLDICVYSHSC